MKQMIRAPKIEDLTENDLKRRVRLENAVLILVNNAWFEYLKALEIFDQFDLAYLQACNSFEDLEKNSDIRPINIVLYGEKNTGKTTLSVKYRSYCENIAKKKGYSFSKNDLKYFEIPVRVTFKRMFASILEKFGIIIRGSALRSIHTDVLIDKIIEELRAKQVKILFLDEIQNLLKANKDDKEDIFIGFKKLTNQSQTRLILMGTPDIIDLFRDVDWVDERFRILHLPPWDLNEEFLDLLYSIFEAYMDFFPDWDIINEDGKIDEGRGTFLHTLSEGRLGKLIQTIKYGAVSALLNHRTNIIDEDYNTILNVNYSVKDGNIVTKKKQ
jgi:hypothetical protein